MESVFWNLTNRTAEAQFIFKLCQLLLAGLALVVLLHHLRKSRGQAIRAPDWLLPLGFFLLVLHFTALTAYFGAEFFLRREWEWAEFERVAHGLMASGLLVVVAAYLKDWRDEETRLARWLLNGCLVVAVIVLVDLLIASPQELSHEAPHSAAMQVNDLLALLGLGLGMWVGFQGERKGKWAGLVALALAGAALVLHSAAVYLPRPTGILIWNAEQPLLCISMFAFAWAVGDRSGDLLDRIFVRLNLTFIILACLIMMITAGMEKYQYLRLAEERSTNLAEFLRGHIVYYRARGESLEKILHRAEVLKRVVVEFGTLPELRQVNVYLHGQRASFRYAPDWEIKIEIVSLTGRGAPEAGEDLETSFQMIRLPIQNGDDPNNRIEFLGTMDYINAYIGKVFILFYSLFTIMVGLATGIIGIIVSDTDRRLRRQYDELQETHQQLAQAAKLASVGQLAGGMAHEINNPITSILSLGTHMTDENNSAGLSPRQRKNLQLITEQAQRISKIVGSLLTFSRQGRLEPSQVDVEEVLDSALSLVQYKLREGRINLRRKINTELPLVLGDSGRLTEVFVNLVNNAIDAMPEGGTLAIRAFPNGFPEGGVRVEVTDTGRGIPQDDVLRIFDPFFTTKEPGRGTGLGLSISHGIIKDHGGQIWASSQPGVGTTLVVTLPKEAD